MVRLTHERFLLSKLTNYYKHLLLVFRLCLLLSEAVCTVKGTYVTPTRGVTRMVYGNTYACTCIKLMSWETLIVLIHGLRVVVSVITDIFPKLLRGG